MQRNFAILGLIIATLGISAQAQEPAVPTPTPQERVLTVPPIAPDFRPEQKPLPELGRVGVELDRQRPLPLREALALPYDRPCPEWTRQLEEEIGLIRRKGSGRSLVWQLAAAATSRTHV